MVALLGRGGAPVFQHVENSRSEPDFLHHRKPLVFHRNNGRFSSGLTPENFISGPIHAIFAYRRLSASRRFHAPPWPFRLYPPHPPRTAPAAPAARGVIGGCQGRIPARRRLREAHPFHPVGPVAAH